jgi:hypothetical protein
VVQKCGLYDVDAGNVALAPAHAVYVVSGMPGEREDVEIVLQLVHEIISDYLFSDESHQPAKVLTIITIAMRLCLLCIRRVPGLPK